MNFTQMYESFQALENPSFWQDIYMRFYRAWFEGDRWMQYFEGLGTTILVTILALLIGVILGVVVAVIRTGHDQQRKGKHEPGAGGAQPDLQNLRHRHPGHPHAGAAADHGLCGVPTTAGTSPWWARWLWASTPAPMWRRSSAAA